MLLMLMMVRIMMVLFVTWASVFVRDAGFRDATLRRNGIVAVGCFSHRLVGKGAYLLCLITDGKETGTRREAMSGPPVSRVFRRMHCRSCKPSRHCRRSLM
eukprot:TRINITY_DN73211_c0_g1_i1.p1 TRINITY_DN73211_c0_g1~~TRINITY_DN73211_c0_g1_i1.p1  ORF type:complete len:101 (-),score=2.48 TRINITY_DN73211_c0_g1_i1:29-331(-)